MPPVGAEGQSEGGCRGLLGARRTKVGPVEGAEEPVVARVAGHRGGGVAEQALQGLCIGRMLVAGDDSSPQERVRGEQVRPVQVLHRLPDRRVEVGVGEHEQLRLGSGRRGEQRVVGESPLGPPLRHRLDGDTAEVVGEESIPASVDDEVGAHRPRQIRGREVLVPPVRIGEGHEVPRQVGRRELTLQGEDGHGVEGRRGCLVDLGVDDEAAQRDRLARTRRCRPLDMAPCCRRSGVGAPVLVGGALEVEESDDAAHLPAAAPEHVEPLGLPVEPVPGQGRGVFPLEAAHEVDDDRSVLGRRPVGIVLAPHLPGHGGDDAAQVAEEELQVGDRALLCPPLLASHEVERVGPHGSEDAPVAVRVAPPQVGVEEVAHEVMGAHPVGSDLGDREPGQPAEESVRVRGVVEDLTEQAFGRHPRDRRDLEGPLVRRRRHRGDEPPQQTPQDVGGHRGEVRVRVPCEDVDDERHRQGMAVGELEDFAVSVRRHSATLEIGAGVLGVEVAQRDDAEHLGPGGVGAPLRGSGQPAREHRDRRRREPRQEACAEPLVERSQMLVSVDEEHDAPTRPGSDRATVVGDHQRLGTRAEDALRSGAHLPAVDAHDARLRAGGDRRILIQQRALAHPSGSVEEEDPSEWAVLVEGLPEEVELGHATDEVAPPECLEPFPESLRRVTTRPGHHLIVADQRRRVWASRAAGCGRPRAHGRLIGRTCGQGWTWGHRPRQFRGRWSYLRPSPRVAPPRVGKMRRPGVAGDNLPDGPDRVRPCVRASSVGAPGGGWCSSG